MTQTQNQMDERRAYLLRTLQRAPEGSARRIWAAAQLAALDGKMAGGQQAQGERRRSKR